MSSLIFSFWEREITSGVLIFFGAEVKGISAVLWAVGSLLRVSVDHVWSPILARGGILQRCHWQLAHTCKKCLELPERDQDKTVNSHTCKWFPLSWGLGWCVDVCEDKRISELGFAQVWICCNLECTRGFNNRKALCAFLVVFALWNERHPSRSIQLTPEKHLLQFRANVLHWCYQPLP